ncbi:MAG: VOC family protein [Planctomycetota bacterium]
MSSPFVAGVGEVLSADIAVPEHEREMRFYSDILTTGERPLWRDDLMNNRGTPIIGLGARSAEYESLPLQWMPHIQVSQVAFSVSRALELGGQELMHGKDEQGASQWAVLLDPNGAAFGVIPVVAADALAASDTMSSSETGKKRGTATQVGCIAGVELTVPTANAKATREFYREVIGWSPRTVAGEGAGEHQHHDMIGSSGNSVARICEVSESDPSVPPVWLLRIPVGDLPESVRRVREHGGTILTESAGSGGRNASAVVKDPVGSYLALVQG